MQRLSLKVTLRDITPPIWRRLDVPADISLAQLHRILQIAMGWTNSHLHEFQQGRARYGTSDREFGIHRIPETSTRVGDVLTRPKSRLDYLYDFGDSWHHTLIVEAMHDDGAQEMRPAVMTDGRRAGPPEDCGGTFGYDELLARLADPTHEDHDAMVEWVGGRWDAVHVPTAAINRRLARLKLKAAPTPRRQTPRAIQGLPTVDHRVIDFFKRRGRV